MSATDAADLAALRAWVGTSPSDSALGEALDRHGGDVRLTAQEVLRGRLAANVAEPAKFGIEGDYNEDRTENIKALRELLAALALEIDPPVVAEEPVVEMGTVSTVGLYRTDRERVVGS